MPLSNIIIDPRLLNDLAASIQNFITRGEAPTFWIEHATLVQSGIAYFVDSTGRQIKIEEPLALIGIQRHFNSISRSIDETVRLHLNPSSQGLAFEEAVLLAVTRLLPDKLSHIFEFHGETPQWADCSAHIVTSNPPDGRPLAFSIDDPFDPASIVAFSAKCPEDVVRWLLFGKEGWCIPCREMGPDLMTRLRLDNGRTLLLVIQAKCIDTIRAEVTADAIESLTPKNFFKSIVRCQLICPCIFIHFYSL